MGGQLTLDIVLGGPFNEGADIFLRASCQPIARQLMTCWTSIFSKNRFGVRCAASSLAARDVLLGGFLVLVIVISCVWSFVLAVNQKDDVLSQLMICLYQVIDADVSLWGQSGWQLLQEKPQLLGSIYHLRSPLEQAPLLICTCRKQSAIAVLETGIQGSLHHVKCRALVDCLWSLFLTDLSHILPDELLLVMRLKNGDGACIRPLDLRDSSAQLFVMYMASPPKNSTFFIWSFYYWHFRKKICNKIDEYVCN